MKNRKFRFLIYAPPFDENIGGVIALHRLCDLLIRNGEDAFLVPYYTKPKFSTSVGKLKNILYPLKVVKYLLIKYLRIYNVNKMLITPVLHKVVLSDSDVVIYPEVVNGNPLEVKNVVRWLMHKPGYHTGEISYGKGDMYFFYQIIFNDPSLNPYIDHFLTVVWVRDEIYKQTNFGIRTGTCYMLRKGKNRKMVHDVNNSILLDGMSHDEIAKIMNQCEYFISYDTETMYSNYAILCGCKSIVVPKDGVLKEEWQPKKEFRYGIAYGFKDLAEAQKTKHLVYDVLKKLENDSNQSVKVFIQKVYEYFDGKEYIG